MEPRIDVITLAVADLERALAFYRDGLGLESSGVIGTEFVGDEVEPDGAVAMFELQGGLIMCLYPRTELAKDAKVPLAPPNAVPGGSTPVTSAIPMDTSGRSSGIHGSPTHISSRR